MSGARTHVALLRGINLAGRNRLPMKGLAELFEEAGCARVRTYIQSGNVIFQATPGLARRVPALLTGAIAERFGLTVPVVTRTADELDAVVRSNPFLEGGADERALHVAFLADAPTAAAVAALDPDRSPPDAFDVRGREVYLRCPNGLGRSKLTTTWLDGRLGTVSTIRNWRTTLKLRDMALEPG